MTPIKKHVSKTEFQLLLIKQMQNQLCWKTGKYLGSMLTFDFGGKVPVKIRSGETIELGTSTLGVRDCYWELQRGTGIIEDSDGVSDESAKNIGQYIVDAALEDIDFLDSAGRIELVFSNQTVLSVDTTNKYETEDAILVFTFPDKRVYEVSPNGKIFCRSDIS